MPVRESFWNIPHWAEIGQLVLGFLAICVLVYGTAVHIRRWRKGKPVHRTDQVWVRLKGVLIHGIGQLRTAEDRFAGIMHLTIFWGMLVLLMGTIIATVDWDVTHLLYDFQFLKGNIYIIFELVLDVFGLLLLLGLGMAIYRRYILRPEKLGNMSDKRLGFDDAIVIVMLLLIAISGYLVEGLRIAVLQPDWAKWSPVGNLLAILFRSTGDPTNETLHLVMWVFHGLVAFVFIGAVPYTKLFHIITAPLNIYFRSLEPAGALAPARANSPVGVKEWTDFTWKQILDFESCVRCGRCRENCPAFLSGLPVAPRDFATQLSSHIQHQTNGHHLLEVVKPEDIWACSTCLVCTQVCPIFSDVPSAIVDMRRYLVYDGRVEPELQEALANIGRYGNSFGQSPRARAKWTREIQPKIKDVRREPVEYLWFVGDYASYSPSVTDITQNTARVFQKMGLDFGILYDGEQNSGNDVRRVGEEGLFEMLVDKNMKSLARSEYQAIITTDPHSYNTLMHEYPLSQNGNKPVYHYTEILDELIHKGYLKFNKRLDYTVTYQDPCYLGRYNDVYEAPRNVIEATGCRLVEMPRHGDKAMCCGAGGGRIWMPEGKIEKRPSEIRIQEAAALDGVSVFVVTCPKDVTMFRDAVKTSGLEEKIVVKELMELVDEAL